MDTIAVKNETIAESRQRFKDAIWFDWLQEKWVSVLGQGSIGSWTTLFLTRIGCNIMTYDMDVVSSLNLAGQLYSKHHVGLPKVSAIYSVIKDMADPKEFVVFQSRFDEYSTVSPIVISAFDNMKARKVAFQRWKDDLQKMSEEERKEAIFIDGRLSVEDYYIFAVRPGQEERYEKTLFDDSEGEDLSCSLKSTSHCAAGIASDIVSILTNFATNVAEKDEIREVPFSIHKSIQSFTYETE